MISSMVNVVIPSRDPGAVKFMQSKLDENYDIYVVFGNVKTLEDKIEINAGGKVETYFLRLSAQVYVDPAEFSRLGFLVPALLAEYSALALH